MTIAKLRSAGDLLASIPSLLGFVPHDSIVVVGLARGRRLGLMVRVDRADCAVREVAQELGSAIVTQLVRDGAREAIVVSYPGAVTIEPDHSLDALVAAVRARMCVLDAWVVVGDRYRSQWCEDDQCCPTTGLPLPLPPIGGFGATGPRSGRADERSSQERADAARRVKRARARAVAARNRGVVAWRAQRWLEWQSAVAQALDGRFPTDALAGRLLAGLEDSQVRDAVVVSLHGNAHDIAQEVIEGRDPHGIRDVLEMLLTGGGSRDAASVEASVDLSMYLSRAACGPRATQGCAAPLTIAAIGTWWLGDTHTASRLVETAIAADPDYRLARLVAATLAAGFDSGRSGGVSDGLGHLRP